MKIKCFSDEDLMKFADGEIPYTDDLHIESVAHLLSDSPQGEELRKRIEVFIKTRTILKRLIGERNDTG